MHPERPHSKRQIQVGLELRSIAQDFFQRESSGMSLITVTDAEISPDLRQATVLITVLPENKEQAALDFAKRMRTDLRTAIKERLQIKTIPFVEVEIDHGEKHRRHIDDLLRQDKIARGLPLRDPIDEKNKESEEE